MPAHRSPILRSHGNVTTARRLHHGYDAYLAALEVSTIKLEYCDGEIYAMAGGTPAHADLSAAVIRLLGNALAGTCRVSTSDLEVRVEATDLSTFPDVTVVSGERLVSRIDRKCGHQPDARSRGDQYIHGRLRSRRESCGTARSVRACVRCCWCRIGAKKSAW